MTTDAVLPHAELFSRPVRPAGSGVARSTAKLAGMGIAAEAVVLLLELSSRSVGPAASGVVVLSPSPSSCGK